MDGWVQKSNPTIENCFQGIFGRVIGFGFGLGRSSSIPEGIESRGREQLVSPASMHQRPNSATAHYFSAQMLWYVIPLLRHISTLRRCYGKFLVCAAVVAHFYSTICTFLL